MIGVSERRPASPLPAAPRRRPTTIDHVALVGLALVPFLLSDPGRVAADSRQYLYLDPGAFLARASSLWDPSIAAGTVPHQHLGFLWPMGPWFWLTDTVGLPMWVSQRLWLAAVAAAAGVGMLRLCRSLGLGRTAALVAAVCYQCTPYQLAFTARFSVLLLPWAALPWLVLFARRAVAEQSWRPVVWFALVASTAGAVNASSLALVLVAPAAVLIVAAVSGEHRAAVAAGARLAVLTAGASAWWIAGVVVQGRYGLPVLQLTENVDTVAAASTPDEIVRGLGNWVFTSTDGSATGIDQAPAYQDSPAIRAATIALPAIAIGVLAAWRIRGRAVLLGLLASATVIGVGAAPLGASSRYGELWRRFSETSSVGLALRNTPRIVPVVVLVTALALALGLERLTGRVRTVAALAAVAIVAVAISPVARHGLLSGDFDRPEDIPRHWLDLASDLDDGPDGSRILEIPGINFAAYEWGNTVEPILAGLVDRPTIAREVLPAGGAGTVDLLAALDRDLQHDTFDPRSLAPVARLLGAGDVVVRGDLDTDRFGLPDPGRLVRAFLDQPPPGFSVAGRYGGTPDDPLLLRLRLDDPHPRLRADAAAPIVLAGDGDGIVAAAGAGVLDGRRPVLPAVTVDDVALADALDRGGEIVVTDTNRKRATTFFYTITHDTGATEVAGREAPDPTGYDVRFGPYAEASTDARTVAVQLGGTVEATMEGGPEHPEHRAVHAFDGDTSTVWQPSGPPVGQRVHAEFDEPVDAGDARVHAPSGPARVTGIAVTIDGERIDVVLDERAHTVGGQPVPLGRQDITEIEVEITAIEGEGPAGLAEVALGTTVIDEVLRTPIDLPERIEARPGTPVSYVLTRDRGDRTDPSRLPVEADLDRLVEVPADSRFTLGGAAAAGTAPTEGCDDTVVQIDGVGFPVRVEAAGDGTSTLTGCRDVTLTRGRHRITTTRAGSTRIDQLVLLSGGRDRPRTPDVTFTESTDQPRHLAGTVRHAGAPFWMVLAESRNDGWEIDLDGGTVSSTAMVDGYANGWLVVPDDTEVGVSLRWTPQRTVWTGMAVTGVTLVAAALLFFRRRPAVPVPPPVAPGRLRPSATVVGALLLAAATWFVAGAAVALIGLVAVVTRTVFPVATMPMAVVAGASLVVAEFTDRPSLVWVGLVVAGAEVLGARISDQRSATTSAAEPGRNGLGNHR